MCPQDQNGMANSVDPGQAALGCSLSVPLLRTVTVIHNLQTAVLQYVQQDLVHGSKGRIFFYLGFSACQDYFTYFEPSQS